MNPLNDYPAARKIAYHVQWFVNGVLTLAGAIFAVTKDSLDALPQWYVVTLAVAPVLWTYLGLTAQANVPSYEDVVEGNAPVPPPEAGYSVAEALVVGILALVFLVVLLRVL